MNKVFLFVILIMVCSFNAFPENGSSAVDDEIGIKSKIISVKLYQNQAKVERRAGVTLKKGSNFMVFSGLAGGLHDWSVKGSLPKDFKGKIVSLEVEKKALVQKRQKKILELENKLDALKEKDRVYLDELQEIASQEKFLRSITDFTTQAASKELQTRVPQVEVWDATLNYTAKKKKSLNERRREIEKTREELGKEIQKWEFELSQIAGTNYYTNYQYLNKKQLSNRSAMEVQQYADSNVYYGERKRLLTAHEGKIDIEKRVIVNIYSQVEGEAEFTFSYVMPDTYWQMLYDVRASNESASLDVVLYANIYQKTEEDWSDVDLSLSTGSPVTSITPPVLPSWFLDVYRAPVYKSAYPANGKMKRAMPEAPQKQDIYQSAAPESSEADEIGEYKTEVSAAGPFFEIKLPIKQTIPSSTKYQKKLISEYSIAKNDMEFYYQLTPDLQREGILMIKLRNSTPLPWMTGESQIFLENEYTGKINMPFTPIGKKIDIALNIEGRLSAQKELLKKYEDTSGVFGGKRRILYKYKVALENQHPKKMEALVYDQIPVSKNEKINVEIKNLSMKYFPDAEFDKSSDFERGIRRWKISLEPGSKAEITYEIIVTFDEGITVNGLK